MSSRDPLQEWPELQELKDALSLPASPDFCARVRHQVASEPVRSRFFGAQRLAVAAAVVVATTIGVIATYRSGGVDGANVSRAIVTDAPKPPVPAPSVSRARVIAVKRTVSSFGPAFETPYRTLVPDDQIRALDRLLAAMREGRATVPPAELNEELNDNGQRVPRALTIEPMKLELLVKDPIK